MKSETTKLLMQILDEVTDVKEAVMRVEDKMKKDEEFAIDMNGLLESIDTITSEHDADISPYFIHSGVGMVCKMISPNTVKLINGDIVEVDSSDLEEIDMDNLHDFIPEQVVCVKGSNCEITEFIEGEIYEVDEIIALEVFPAVLPVKNRDGIFGVSDWMDLFII